MRGALEEGPYSSVRRTMVAVQTVQGVARSFTVNSRPAGSEVGTK